MPIPLPQLDIRSYDDLVREGIDRISRLAPEWTDHNPSDPGIALIELLSYFTEMLLFSSEQLSSNHLQSFLQLVTGREPISDNVVGEWRVAVSELTRTNRAVTCADFETLALAADPRVARAQCVPRRDLTESRRAARHAERTGHVSVLVVAKRQHSEELQDILYKVSEYLQLRRLLTVRVHVAEPARVPVALRLLIVPTPGSSSTSVQQGVVRVIENHFDLLEGGNDSQGWQFGRNVFLSELYELLDRVPGVDYVSRLSDPATGELLDAFATRPEFASRIERNSQGDVVEFRLREDEAPWLDTEATNIRVGFVAEGGA